MLALAGVWLLLVAAETAREMTNAEPGESVLSNLGYAVAEAGSGAYIAVAVALVMGGVVYPCWPTYAVGESPFSKRSSRTGRWWSRQRSQPS
jgi:hypothetical protein